MKHIDVQKQPVLSLSRTFGIALRGVQYRLFRALVTVAVIAVAMAFLMNILSESLFKRVVASAVREEIREMRQADQWIARLSLPQTREELLARLAGSEGGGAVRREAAGFSGRGEAVVGRVVEQAREADGLIRFFDDLNYGRRRVLVGSASGAAIFDLLQDSAARERFFLQLQAMRAVRMPMTPDVFRAFLDRWPELAGFLQSVREGQQAAIERLHAGLNGRTVLQALADAEGAFGDAIRAAGFVLEPAEAASLAAQVRLAEDRHVIEDSINNTALRQALAARFDLMPGDVTLDMIWDLLRKEESARWFAGLLKEHASVDLSAPRLAEVAASRARAKLLVRSELMTLGAGGGFMDIGPRMTWLAFVSMLVCTVGIANAMLMSVTERFREIATLKCLGALDGFIMTVFLIEAAILGLVGGIAGTLIGLVLGLARMGAAFGGLLAELFPAGLLAQAAGVSILTGIALAAVAAAYPSLRAARLAPMEAMRIE